MFTTSFLLKCDPKDTDNYCINVPSPPLIIEIIKAGELGNVPQRLLKPSLINKDLGCFNRTYLMEIAKYGLLHVLPKPTVTKENINLRDSLSNSALYHCCRTGEIKLIPKSFYSAKHLTAKNNKNRNCLH